MPTPASLSVLEISNPLDLALWTTTMYSSFRGTNHLLFDTLSGLDPHAKPSQTQLDAAVETHRKNLTTKPSSDGGQSRYIQILDASTGEVMGGAKWIFYAETPRMVERVSVDWIDGAFQKAFAQATMDEFHGRRYKFMNCPHALLNLCFTAPGYERRGVGNALVRWGLEIADQMGLRSFTEASLRGAPVYARLAFEVREDVCLRWDDRGDEWRRKEAVRWVFMERPAVEEKEG